jgi:hypothetical protein
MRAPDDVLEYLRHYAGEQAKLEKDRLEILNSPLPPALKDERDVDLKKQIADMVRRKLEVLADFASFPPFHERHQKLLKEFHGVAGFDKSVFIMTKFPDPASQAAIDQELRAVIKAVQDALERCQFVPRIALEKDYHPVLWDNVELFLLGCGRGIAIVEDRYKPELNPNVAMEWGWMRGLGRNVLYLVEQKFNQKRADWSGLIEHGFDWGEPAKEIAPAVHKWLGCGLPH